MESDTKPEAVGVALDVAVDVAVDVFEVEVGDGLPGADEARLEERLEECQDPVDTFTARGAIVAQVSKPQRSQRQIAR